MRQTIDCHLVVDIVCFTLWRNTMTNGFHHDSEMTEKDQSDQQDEGNATASATCVAEKPVELNDSASEIEFDDHN